MRKKIYLVLTVGILLPLLIILVIPVFSASPTAYAQTTSSSNTKSSLGSSNINLSCNVGFNPLTWLLCPAVDGMNAIVNQLSNALEQELTVGGSGSSTNPSQIFCASATPPAGSPCTSYEQAWATVRYIALGLLFMIGLVIIMAQALGMEFLDAYTVKRAMPRLVAAAVLITLSWPLMGFFVKFTNDLGYGIQQLMYSPFSHFSDTVNFGGGGATALAVIGGGGAIAALGIFGLLTFAATAALSVFVAFLVMIIRQLLIVLLVILAPLAIVLMILPNTQKAFRLWYKQFGVALMMFPIIMAIIAAGRIFSAISLQGSSPSAIDQFIGFAAFYAPYFMLPFTFKLAGGALGSISGQLQNATQGFNRGMGNIRKKQMAKNMSNIQAGKRWQGNRVANTVSRGLMNASLLGSAGVVPTKMRGRYRAARSQRISTLTAEGEKNEAVGIVTGNDDLLTASLSGGMNEKSTREYLESKGQSGAVLEQNVAAVERARRSMGVEAWADYAAVANAGTKTGYGSGPAEMLETINKVAGGDRARAGRLLNAARGQAERARRIDLYGSGFGTSLDQMNILHQAGVKAKENGGVISKDTIDDANKAITDDVAKTRSAGEIASSSTTGLNIMVPALQRRIENAHTQYGEDSSEYKKAMAFTASYLDAAGSISPANVEVLRDGILGKPTGKIIPVKTERRPKADASGGLVIDPSTNLPEMEDVVTESRKETYSDVIERLRSDPEWRQYRREYSSEAAQKSSGDVIPPAPSAPPGS